MAPLGQTVVQAPQPTQRWGSTMIPARVAPPALPLRDASLRIARAEQTSIQALQPIFSLRLCAQTFCL